MRLVIARSTLVLSSIESKISVPLGRITKEEYLTMISNFMVSSPENILVVVLLSAVDGPEEFKIHGFIIAMNPAVGDYISVLQAWSEEELLQPQLIDALEIFSEERGKQFIRQEIPWSDQGFITKLNLPLKEICLVAEAKIGG